MKKQRAGLLSGMIFVSESKRDASADLFLKKFKRNILQKQRHETNLFELDKSVAERITRFMITNNLTA